jgi:low-density lipoprotein receptor-related protein 1 (alpha-2-macroglobulin receptor)
LNFLLFVFALHNLSFIKSQNLDLVDSIADYNECDSFPCSHFCYNTVGSYRCVCSSGYAPIDGGRSCKAVSDVQPSLLYSNKHFIRNVSFKGDQRFLVRANLTNAVALDFEWTSQCLFWSDVTPSASSISKWCLNDPADHVEILHSSTVHNPDGIAVDWIAKNLYWCDKGTDTIEVSRLDGGSRKILLKDGLQVLAVFAFYKPISLVALYLRYA